MKRIEKLLFKIDLPNRHAYPGALLVAEPFLRESYFNHSVICLVDYDRHSSSMGLVMNRQTNYMLSDLISGIRHCEKIPVYCGGPMSCDRLFFVHTLGDIIPDSQPITEGLYVGGNFDTMLEYVNGNYPIEGYIRFCLGYSGWGAGQLDDELKRNVWAVAPVLNPSDLLCGSEDSYWHRQVKLMGQNYRGWLYHPQNPRLN